MFSFRQLILPTALAGSVLLGMNLRPGAPQLRIEFEAVVTMDDPTGVYVEPAIAVDPADPRRMVIAAIHVREPGSDAWQDRQTVAVFASADGGRSWSRRRLEGLPDAWAAGDPWLAWGPGSLVYLAAIVAESITRRGAVQFTGVFSSEDGGWTWRGEPVRPFPDSTRQDHPWIGVADSAVVVAGSIADGSAEGLYVARGRASQPPSFLALERVEPGWDQVNLGGGALMADGAVVASYYTMVPPRRYAARRMVPGGAGASDATLAEDILPVGFPPIARRPGADQVFAVWAEGPEPAITLRLGSSEDAGRTWHTGASVGPGAEASLRTLPALAVAPDGTVAATWQDFEGGAECTHLHGAVSVDGGRTFLLSVRVSSAASCFGTPANGAAATRFRLGGGDYQGLASVGDGPAFQAVWADSRGGTFQIHTARLNVVDAP